jgi:hypothetical protein
MIDDFPPWAYLLIGGGLAWWYFRRHHQGCASCASSPYLVQAAPAGSRAAAAPPGMLTNANGQYVPKPSWWDAPDTTAQMRIDYLAPDRNRPDTIKWS